MYSWAGNLHNGWIEQVDQSLAGHFDPLCYSFYFGYHSRIEHAVIKDQSATVLCLQGHVPVRNTTERSSYVKCQDQFSTSTAKC